MYNDFVRLARPDNFLTKYLEIPRHIKWNENDVNIHGFCDASELSYACCVYVGSKSTPHTLVYARHRNTPRKNRQTIPRNELNGMVLCVEAMDVVMEALKEYNPKVRLWCDSQVALAWVQGVAHHDKWTTYVRNRVKKVSSSKYPVSVWNFVETNKNPAGLANRPWKSGTKKTIFDCLLPLWTQGLRREPLRPAYLDQSLYRELKEQI